MGVDCRIYLPGNVQIRDVAIVLAAVDGVPVQKSYFTGAEGYAARAAVQVKGIDTIPSCATIDWEADGKDPHHCMYHYEVSERPGWRLLMPRSYAFWIAAGKRLVDFFGGELDYNDCDTRTSDYFRPSKSNEENCPSNGAAWYSLQDRLLAIQPLTDEELAAADRVAAYKMAEAT